MIAPEGWPFVLAPIGVGSLLWLAGWPRLGLVFIAFGLFSLAFFRDPERTCEGDELTVCSPADGKIVFVGASPPELAELGLPRQLSIFMSVFNVHVNRAAISGTLIDYSYHKGRKISAFKDKASLENEQNLSLWEGPAGRVGLKQIAGLVARRIVFDHRPGDEVARGERIGLIRYGSRVDVFVPEDATILVSLGETVRAGATPVARFATAGQP
jgi:phosphatidylserine decarboxylase